MMFILVDSFRDREVSRHRTPEAAAKRAAKEVRAARRLYGQTAGASYALYVPKGIQRERAPEWAQEEYARAYSAEKTCLGHGGFR